VDFHKCANHTIDGENQLNAINTKIKLCINSTYD